MPGSYKLQVELCDVEQEPLCSTLDKKLVLACPSVAEVSDFARQKNVFEMTTTNGTLRPSVRDMIALLERVFMLGVETGHQIDRDGKWLPSEFDGHSTEFIEKAMER
ncbi:MAG: hypothetical protein V1895_03180 [Parcubacteria group bacterium]